MNYAPYLGAIRGEHVRAAARSIGAALIEQPVLEACRSLLQLYLWMAIYMTTMHPLSASPG